MGDAAGARERPKGLKLLALALQNRKSATMLALGFASGLPFALLVGTLNAWLGEVGITLATIGVLSWIGLSYSFKFLWSPIVDRVPLPALERLGRRKSWIFLCQLVVIGVFALLAAIDPAQGIGIFALIAFVGALASATQDIAIDGWRIDQADEDAPIELLSALNQFGYRTASIVGGALALVMATTMSWPMVYLAMGGAMLAVTLGVTLRAPDSPRPEPGKLHGVLAEPGALRPEYRALALAAVGVSWLWAIGTILHFMLGMLGTSGDAPPPSVADFTKYYGPWIIVATVFVPLGVASLTNWMTRRDAYVLHQADPVHNPVRTAMNHLYSALVAPLAELAGRLGWGVLSVIGFILTYAICYNIWASFAYPFYLQELAYSKEEVAFASKVFGIFMTMAGISLGGYLFAKLGRFPTILLGAVLPPLGNFLYADLADGGKGIDAFARFLRLDVVAGWFAADDRMLRLLLAICYENIVTGLALTAFVAYVSSIVSKQYGAIQYALLGSLVSLVGTLGRGATGEAFDQFGYAVVFRWTALTAVVSTVFVLLEWARSARAGRTAQTLGDATDTG
jgi:PAT family beta-lactamase induction signal transducer AmpG